ncbi:MAG TPA: sigma-70 family RNA polymerase sigma factor [Gammaproteobacteria bacterium]|nr:sigma-70 family RNA polymerase sigma factor [Gammaproteobacteria bacterium]
MNTADLVAAIANGDRSAETALVTRYGQALRYVLLREVGDRDLADDLYQETLLIVITRLRTRGLEAPDKLAGFLVGVARQLARAHRREQMRRATMPPAEELADPSPSPCEWAIRAEEAEAVRAAIARLPVKRDRDLLRRRYFIEEDARVSCSVLSLDSRQLNRMIHRARTRLREEIGKMWLEPADAVGKG